MKKHLLLLAAVIMSSVTASGQMNEIRFTYDEAGNRISRADVALETLYERGIIEMSQSNSHQPEQLAGAGQ